MASDTSPNAAGQLPPSLPLITYDPLQGYMLQEAACSFLRNLPQDKNCHVLCIVGKVKTGKSFLLNELLKDNDAINKQDNHSHHEHTLKEQEHTCH